MRAGAPAGQVRLRPWVTALPGAVARCWRAMGVRGRLVGAMIACYPLAFLAADLRLTDRGDLGALIIGSCGVAFFCCWLELVQIRSRRRWRERKAKVIPGGLQQYFPDGGVATAAHTARLDHAEKRIDHLETRMSAVGDALEAVCELAGAPVPKIPEEMPTAPVLRLVRGGDTAG